MPAQHVHKSRSHARLRGQPAGLFRHRMAICVLSNVYAPDLVRKKFTGRRVQEIIECTDASKHGCGCQDCRAPWNVAEVLSSSVLACECGFCCCVISVLCGERFNLDIRYVYELSGMR